MHQSCRSILIGAALCLTATATAHAQLLDQSPIDGNGNVNMPNGDAFAVENFFAGLKRHDPGPAFHERQNDGSTDTGFVIEPLWGVDSTAPYGHDGRSINLDQVILRHGGEALQVRQAYEPLTGDQRSMVRELIETRVLFPRDDTASNLNPGYPASQAGIQAPSVHGTIDLGELFQTPSVGPE